MRIGCGVIDDTEPAAACQIIILKHHESGSFCAKHSAPYPSPVSFGAAELLLFQRREASFIIHLELIWAQRHQLVSQAGSRAAQRAVKLGLKMWLRLNGQIIAAI